MRKILLTIGIIALGYSGFALERPVSYIDMTTKRIESVSDSKPLPVKLESAISVTSSSDTRRAWTLNALEDTVNITGTINSSSDFVDTPILDSLDSLLNKDTAVKILTITNKPILAVKTISVYDTIVLSDTVDFFDIQCDTDFYINYTALDTEPFWLVKANSIYPVSSFKTKTINVRTVTNGSGIVRVKGYKK